MKNLVIFCILNFLLSCTTYNHIGSKYKIIKRINAHDISVDSAILNGYIIDRLLNDTIQYGTIEIVEQKKVTNIARNGQFYLIVPCCKQITLKVTSVGCNEFVKKIYLRQQEILEVNIYMGTFWVN